MVTTGRPEAFDAAALGTEYPIKHVVFLIKENRTFDNLFGKHSIMSGVPPMRRRRPPGRMIRAASGIQTYGSHQIAAPYSETAKSELSSANGGRSASAWTSGKCSPNSRWSIRAVASCLDELSSPTGRAPRRASQAQTYAVPQPSSIASSPVTSGSRPSSDSGTPQMPQSGSPAHERRPRSTQFGASSSHETRFRSTWSWLTRGR